MDQLHAHTVLHNDPLVAAQLRDMRSALSTVRHAGRAPQARVTTAMTGVPVGYMDRMKAMSKELRGLSRAELTRRQRSTIYENAVDIVDDLYDTSAFGGDTAAWGRVRDALPHRGVGPSGGADITGKNLWRSIKILFDTPAGRANALMLVVKCAKVTSGLGRSHLPFLRQMAETLGFPLVIMAGSTGMADTFSVTEDGGIVVRAAAATVTHAERGAAEALLQLGSRRYPYAAISS